MIVVIIILSYVLQLQSKMTCQMNMPQLSLLLLLLFFLFFLRTLLYFFQKKKEEDCYNLFYLYVDYSCSINESRVLVSSMVVDNIFPKSC
jgi:hypothetical protein